MRYDLTKPFKNQYCEFKSFVNMVDFYKENLDQIKNKEESDLSNNEKYRLSSLNILEWDRKKYKWKLSKDALDILKEIKE